MKWIIITLVIAFCANLAFTNNAGAVAGISMDVLNRMKEQYFPTMMKDLTGIEVENTEDKNLKTRDIKLQVLNDDHKNIKFQFIESRNEVKISVFNTQLLCTGHVKYKKLFFKVSGNATVKGLIKELSITLKLGKQRRKGFFVPKVITKNVNVDLNKKDWKLDFEWDKCLIDVVDIVLDMLRGTIVNKIEKALEEALSQRVSDTLNEKLKEIFPTDIEITDKITMATGLTREIGVRKNHLILPVDGTMYLTKEGYNRPVHANEIATEEANEYNQVFAFANRYLHETLLSCMNKISVIFARKVEGKNVILRFNGTQIPLEASFVSSRSDQKIQVSGGGLLLIPFYGIEVTLKSKFDVRIVVKPGNGNTVFTVIPKIDKDSIEIETSGLSIFGESTDIDKIPEIVTKTIQNLIDDHQLTEYPILSSESILINLESPDMLITPSYAYMDSNVTFTAI